jgi:SHS2 domain-containing protein
VYRWVDHTAELELELEADREQEIFAEALAALSELLADGVGGEPERLEIELRADDRAGLLADWLDELVYLADAKGFVPARVADLVLDGSGLRATVEGNRGEPRQLVKAVTRHRLEFRRAEQGWRARVVLDV